MPSLDVQELSLPIPREVWIKLLGELLEDLVHDFLDEMGVPALVRIRVSKGDVDIVIFDVLRNIVYIVEVKNLSGDYQLTQDRVDDQVIGKFRRIEEWIERNYGRHKVKRILIVSNLNCKRTISRQLRKAHRIKIVETGIQVIPDGFRSKLPVLRAQINSGIVTNRAFSKDCKDYLFSALRSSLYPLLVPNEWDKKRMFDGLSDRMTFQDAISRIKSVNYAGFVHLLAVVPTTMLGQTYRQQTPGGTNFLCGLTRGAEEAGKPPPIHAFWQLKYHQKLCPSNHGYSSPDFCIFLGETGPSTSSNLGWFGGDIQ